MGNVHCPVVSKPLKQCSTPFQAWIILVSLPIRDQYVSIGSVTWFNDIAMYYNHNRRYCRPDLMSRHCHVFEFSEML